MNYSYFVCLYHEILASKQDITCRVTFIVYVFDFRCFCSNNRPPRSQVRVRRAEMFCTRVPYINFSLPQNNPFPTHARHPTHINLGGSRGSPDLMHLIFASFLFRSRIRGANCRSAFFLVATACRAARNL